MKLKTLKDIMEHCEYEHPEDCGCYMCHHQGEYKVLWNELRQEAIKWIKEGIYSPYSKFAEFFNITANDFNITEDNSK